MVLQSKVAFTQDDLDRWMERAEVLRPIGPSRKNCRECPAVDAYNLVETTAGVVLRLSLNNGDVHTIRLNPFIAIELSQDMVVSGVARGWTNGLGEVVTPSNLKNDDTKLPIAKRGSQRRNLRRIVQNIERLPIEGYLQSQDKKHAIKPPRTIGISWFNFSSYNWALEHMADANILPRTYDDWLEQAVINLSEAKSQGFAIVQVEIQPEEFSTWCAARGMNLDASARSLFASLRAFHYLENH